MATSSFAELSKTPQVPKQRARNSQLLGLPAATPPKLLDIRVQKNCENPRDLE